MDKITAQSTNPSPDERDSVADEGMAGQIHQLPDPDLLIYLPGGGLCSVRKEEFIRTELRNDHRCKSFESYRLETARIDDLAGSSYFPQDLPYQSFIP